MRQTAAIHVSRWLSLRHSLRVEAALVIALYLTYEAARGLVANGNRVAAAHAHTVASLERSLHLYGERSIQHAALTVPGLIGSLNVGYLSLHLIVTAGVLLWLHQRQPAVFPFVRTTLLLASALALAGFVAFPTAPPRLAALGISDTISGRHLNLNHGLISSVYNPYAAVPSMHVGYALVVGASVIRHGGRPALRALGAVYPVLVLFVVVATGNHFFFDAATGALTVALAAAAAVVVLTPTHAQVVDLPAQRRRAHDRDEVAA